MTVQEPNQSELTWLAQMQETGQLLHEHYVGPSKSPDLPGLDKTWVAWQSDNSDGRVDANAVGNGLGLCFGQQLVGRLGFRWAVITDNYGTELGCIAQPGDITVLPASLTARRLQKRSIPLLRRSLLSDGEPGQETPASANSAETSLLSAASWAGVRCGVWLVRRGYEASFRTRIGLAPIGVQWGTKVAEALDARVNARVPRRVKDDLVALSRRRRVEESELARALLDEALRREKHPGIVFRSTPAGREAAMEGRRVYVWQVIETLRASDGKVEPAASFLGLRPDQVRAAVSYYAEYKREIDALIALNKDEADRARRLWEREKRALGS